MIMKTDLNVFFNGKLVEKSDILEGSCDAHLVYLNGSQVVGILTAQHDGSSCGLVNLGQEIEDGGLAGTVGADKSADFRSTDPDIEFVDGYKSAEIYSQMGCLENEGLSEILLGNKIGTGYINEFYFGRFAHFFFPPFEIFIRTFLANISILPLSFSLLVTSITRISTIA